MSNICFDFLSDSMLFHEAEQGYKSRSIDELDKELNRYREYVAANQQEIDNEILRNDVNIIQELEKNPKLPTLEELLQGCLFLDTYVINDPVYNFDLTIEKYSNIARQCMGMTPKSDNELKNELAKYANYMKSLTDGVRCDTGYVKFYPFAKKLRPTSDYLFNIPDLSIDGIDKNVFLWFLAKMEIFNIDQYNRIDKQMKLSNKIALRFKDDSSSLMVIQYQKINPVKIDGDSGIISLEYKYIPTKEEYDNWVNQEITKTIKDKIDFLLYRNTISEKFNSPIILSSLFEKEFFETNFSGIKSSNLYKLGFDLDFTGLKNMDFNTAMSIRRNAKDSFKKFQEEIQKDSIFLSCAKDKKEYSEALDGIKQKYLNGIENVKSTLEVSKDIVSSNIIQMAISACSYFATPYPYNEAITGLTILDLIRDMKNAFSRERKNPFYFLKKMIG